MVRAIIFDCFGVLTTDSWKLFLDGLSPEADIETARESHRAYDAGLITKQECQQAITAATGQSFVELEDSHSRNFVKNTALLDYIRQLKQSYKIGLLSNVASSWISDTFLSDEEQRLFDTMVFSYQVGFTKPDQRIFEITCDRLGVKVQEAILVDDIDRYCAAAKELGMEAVLYKNLTQLQADLEKLLTG